MHIEIEMNSVSKHGESNSEQSSGKREYNENIFEKNKGVHYGTDHSNVQGDADGNTGVGWATSFAGVAVAAEGWLASGHL